MEENLKIGIYKFSAPYIVGEKINDDEMRVITICSGFESASKAKRKYINYLYSENLGADPKDILKISTKIIIARYKCEGERKDEDYE